MFVFAVFVTFITFGSYIVQNYLLGHDTLATIEVVMTLLLLGAYLDFRRNYAIQRALQLLIFTVSTVTLSGLYFPGVEPLAILFWSAALPLFVFLLLGYRVGLYWSLINITGILAIILFSTLDPSNALFQSGLLFQILFGYLVVSAIAYYFERQRSTLESRLFTSLKERESLLKEVHHRVKNNMQVMMGLLWLQSENIDDNESSKVLLTNIDRLSAMAALHERLYRQDNLQRIDMPSYLQAIVAHLQTITDHTIHLACDPLSLDMHNAMQVGLITNEAVTNAVQHAFDTPDHGEILVSLHHRDGHCNLNISDNGKGMEKPAENDSLGTLLIKDFASALPNATLEITTSPSVSLNLSFDSGAVHAA